MTRGRLLRALRRSPLQSLLTVLAVLIATALAGTGAIIAAQLAASSGALADEARLPDLLQMHAGDVDPSAIAAFADAHPEILDTQLSELVGIDAARLELTPGESEAASSVEWGASEQNPRFDLLLDADGGLAEAAPGTVGVPVAVAAARGIAVGDPLEVMGQRLVVSSLIRDAGMGSELSSSRRLLVNEADLDRIRAAGTGSEWLIEFRLADPARAGEVYDAYLAAGLPASGPMVDASSFRLLLGLSDGLVAAAVLVAGGLLGVIAGLVLSLTIRTAIAGELREIGVLRAIGLPGRALRALALGRHLALLGAGAVLGALAALALSPLATASIRLRLGGEPSPWIWAAAAAIALIAVGLGWLIARAALRPALRGTPLAAMRGEPRRRTPRRAGLRARRRPRPAWLATGLAAIRRARADHLAVAGVLLAATLLAAVPLSLRATLAAPETMRAAGVAASDLQIDLRQDEATGERIAQLEATLAADPDIARHGVFLAERVPALARDGEWSGLNIVSGDHAAFPLDYRAGRAPSSSGELALSELNASAFGVDVGARVALELPDGARELAVVGIYRDVTRGGLTARGILPPGSGTPVWTNVLVDLAPGADHDAALARYAQIAAPARVSDVDQARESLLGPLAAGLDALALAASAAALALAALLTALALRLFLVRDCGRQAVAQSIGAPLAAVRAEHRLRVLAPCLLGILAGIALAPALGSALLAGAGAAMGASGLPLRPDWLLGGAVVPLLLAGAVALVVQLSVRRLDPSQAARLVGGQDL